jgi:hypothetical protein
MRGKSHHQSRQNGQKPLVKITGKGGDRYVTIKYLDKNKQCYMRVAEPPQNLAIAERPSQ